MSKQSWLDDFAKSWKANKEKKQKKLTASVNKNVDVKDADMIIMSKTGKLSTAKVGTIVKYQNKNWKVVNASYKDSKGTGVVMERLADVSTKPVVSEPERARNEEITNVDYNVREATEIPDFTENADATAEKIARDNAKDNTTPAGRFAPEPEVVATPEMPMENPEVVEEDVEPVEDEEALAPVEDEEDDFTFDDVDEEPFEDVEDEQEEEEEKKAEASKKRSNPILASITKKKRVNPVLASMLK